MPAGLGHVLDRNRNLPGRRRFFSALRSLMSKSLGTGKDDLAANERAVLLGIELLHRRARIARESSGSGRRRPPERYCVPAPSQTPVRPPRRGLRDKRLAGRRKLRRRLHPLRHGQVADPHFPQIGVEIAAKRVEKLLPQGPVQHPPGGPAGSAAAPDAARSGRTGPRPYPAPVIGVKCRRTGLRHDRAIERVDGAGLGIAPKRR